VYLFGFIGYILSSIVVIFGVISTFKKNVKIDNTNYIERVIVIGLPVGVRVLLAYWCIYIAIVLTNAYIGFPFYLWITTSVLAMPLYYLAFFYLIGSALGNFSSNKRLLVPR
jgi:hypothetical protein